MKQFLGCALAIAALCALIPWPGLLPVSLAVWAALWLLTLETSKPGRRRVQQPTRAEASDSR